VVRGVEPRNALRQRPPVVSIWHQAYPCSRRNCTTVVFKMSLVALSFLNRATLVLRSHMGNKQCRYGWLGESNPLMLSDRDPPCFHSLPFASIRFPSLPSEFEVESATSNSEQATYCCYRTHVLCPRTQYMRWMHYGGWRMMPADAALLCSALCLPSALSA
jgi:hypothetical protein